MGIHFQRGQVLFELKRYREAADAYRQELAENPQQAIVHAILAAVLLNMRQLRSAEIEIRQAIELDPELAYAYYILSYVEQHRGRYAEAENAIRVSIRLEHSPESFHQSAVIEEHRGRYSEALTATADALRLNPRFTPAIILRGKLLARDGKWQDAHALYSTALAHNPEDASAHHALGAHQLRNGDAGVALDLLREARRLDPLETNDSSAIALAYGRLLRPMQQANAAVLHWHQWSPKARWLMFAVLAAVFAIASWQYGPANFQQLRSNPAWLVLWLSVLHFAALPYSLNRLASAIGGFLLRREFGWSWWSIIRQPLILAPAIAVHAFASVVAYAVARHPVFGTIACLFAASFPLFSTTMRAFFVHAVADVRNPPGFLCIPPLFLLMAFGSTAAFIVAKGDDFVGAVILGVIFAISFFSDDAARWLESC